MYRNFYGFKKYPFCNTPDTEFFFNSEKHTEALAHLTYVISERKGFAVITGDIGAGKTIVSRELLNRLDINLEVGLLTNTCLKEDDFLQAICEEFNIPTENKQTGQLLSSLNDFFIQCLSKNKNVVLIIDEAQNLSSETLEKIRMLSNLETEREKLIQIILLGQPELKELLNQSCFEQLRQRINLWYHLRPLNFAETRDYVDHRLGIVGSSAKKIFSVQAVQSIFYYSKGIPRIINTLCDNTLLIGYIRGTKQIDTPIVEEVVRDLGMVKEEVVEKKMEAVEAPAEPAKRKPIRFSSSRAIAAAAAFVVVVGFSLLVLQRGPKNPPISLAKDQGPKNEPVIVEPAYSRIKEQYRTMLLDNFKAVWNEIEKRTALEMREMSSDSVEPEPQTNLTAQNIDKLNLIPTESEL